TSRMFFLFYFKSFKVPFTPLRFPRRLMDSVLRIANEVHIKPLVMEDVVACEAEQEGYDRYFDEPIAEINPAVHAFQALTIRKWEAHLERERQRAAGPNATLRAKGTNDGGEGTTDASAARV